MRLPYSFFQGFRLFIYVHFAVSLYVSRDVIQGEIMYVSFRKIL